MRNMMHRHLGKVVAGAAVALAGTAALAAVTLPGDAGAAGGGSRAAAAAGPESQTGQVRPGAVERAPAEGREGVGRDPLTDDEIARAQALAAPPAFRGAAEDVRGRRGPERLTTDLAELGPEETGRADAPRRANVSFYDYRSEAYVTKTVNLTTGKVEKTDSRHGVQPPPDRAESEEAAGLLIAAPEGEGLRKDYKRATGKDLTGPGQLAVTGFVYRGAAEGPAPEKLRACGQHRCVRLFTKVRNGQWIDTRRYVIDLSARTVGRLD
ncbi:Tat pathway signal sequence domain protein [Streptomyces sp. WAC 06725]|uniref:Tat pathway signal sequence domain protein n=1 Tax=Streptomyces sp. WAC 06725 TaxID=2203209 RepID=UPI000F741DAA|nr:Tat pathway signal sequence domain protein [Streptomyces sp. WAC 06725]RSO30852.1 Tat pathway signal sequence domain protein [Streptomyces sp. WAC 06725]